mmetsp:Transcript_4393/g.6196  ORF Transcript_4393/g.6196 Transcript_4393/m.6196 type:complete len:81 (-) Transcript_4393:17-259(-)
MYFESGIIDTSSSSTLHRPALGADQCKTRKTPELAGDGGTIDESKTNNKRKKECFLHTTMMHQALVKLVQLKGAGGQRKI